MLFATLFLGCNGVETAGDSEVDSAESTLSEEEISKVAVMVDGTVYLNSEAIPIESLAEKLEALSAVKEIWYFRESPEAEEPHENAMKAIEAIANRKLPIALYTDREFTHRLKLGKPADSNE